MASHGAPLELQQQLSAMIGAALSGDAAAQRSVHDLNEQGAPELVPTALALAKSEGLPPPVRYFASTIVLHQARTGKLDGAAAMWQAMLAQAPGEVNLFLAVAAAACRTGANFVGPLISHALELARANDPRSALQLLRAIGDEAGRLNGAADSELVRALSAGAGQMLSIAVGSLRVAMSAAESEGGIAQLALECIACWATHGQLALATLGLCGSCETAHALAAIVLGASPQTLGSVAELLEPLTSSAQRGARAAAPGSAESADSWEASLAVLAPAVAARALETDASTAPASHALARCAAALVRADRARVARGEIPGTPELVRALVHLAHAYDYLTAAMAIEAMAELLEVARAHEQAHMALMPALLARARMPPSASPGALSADELDDPPQLEYPEADDDGDDDEPRSAPRASGQRNVFSERRLTHARAPRKQRAGGRSPRVAPRAGRGIRSLPRAAARRGAHLLLRDAALAVRRRRAPIRAAAPHLATGRGRHLCGAVRFV